MRPAGQIFWLRPARLRALLLFLAVFRFPGRFIILSIIAKVKSYKNPCKPVKGFLHYRQIETKCRGVFLNRAVSK
jgi:hypothetical protein